MDKHVFKQKPVAFVRRNIHLVEESKICIPKVQSMEVEIKTPQERPKNKIRAVKRSCSTIVNMPGKSYGMQESDRLQGD